MPSLVALDLETTGLNPRTDSIIEIGLVRFNEKRIEAEWSTLINPGQPIPPFITQLTNITNEMVRKAPAIGEVFQQMLDFIGTSPILGHNVQFDLSFIKADRYLPYNVIVDTFDLAAVLYPTFSRYNLGALAQNLGIILRNAHRALDDARSTAAVYNKCLEKARSLPLSIIAELVRQSEEFSWGATYPFKQILKEQQNTLIAPAASDMPFYLHNFIEAVPAPPRNPQPQGLNLPLDPDEVAGYFEAGGALASNFSQYENRSQQIAMTRSVARAFSEGYHLMVEAGTGTGKSFAYLLPASLWAVKNDTRVIISTNTINLQDQLSKKDVPEINRVLDLGIQVAVLKGRSNYLCPRRFENLRAHGPENAEEMRVLGKLLVWLHEGGKGDRNEITLTGPVEREIWSRLSAEDDVCTGETCVSRMGGACPFFQAHQRAEQAHLIIVNHALLLADVATGSRLLPDYNYLIVDEAHHLESATTNALSTKLSEADITRLLRELGGSNGGILGHLSAALRGLVRPSDFGGFIKTLDQIDTHSFDLSTALRAFYLALEEFMMYAREGQPVPSYGQQLRILPSTHTVPNWEPVEMTWLETYEHFHALNEILNQLVTAISSGLSEVSEDVADTISNLSSVSRGLQEAAKKIHEMVTKPDSDFIYWVEITPVRNQLFIQIAPLQIGNLMERYLWHEKESIVLTSATLTTNEGFDYIRSRLNADEADELVLGSPFDFESSALLYLVNDIPEPINAGAYQRAIDGILIRLAKATSGRLLALFTSYAQLKKTSATISQPLSEAGIEVYEQGEGASPSTLLEIFKSSEQAVLLGTRSFWEGIDIPGAALSALVIVKLPFDVPSDPIIAARSETYDDPFNEYHLQEAILRFRQGFGRLIRTQSDRGIVVLLDRRIISKKYGRFFIESLPNCTVKSGTMADLPSVAKSWLDL